MSKISKIDQRLAARMTLRQVDSLDRIDGYLNDITKIFVKAQKNLFLTITGELPGAIKSRDFAPIIRQTVRDVSETLADRLTSHAVWSHESAVDLLMDVIPHKYLWGRVSDEQRIAYEQIHHPRTVTKLNMYVNSLWITKEDYDAKDDKLSLPINPTGELALTDEEREELLRRIVFPPPSETQVLAIVGSTGWQDRLESLSQKISDKQIAFDQLVQGYSAGENITEIRKRLDPLVGGIRATSQRIARTEAMRVAEQLQRQTWEGLGDMMAGAQIIAVLDSNTRPEHATRNGQIYYNEPRGNQRSMVQLPDLPDEPNCRCMTVPVLKPPKELEEDVELRDAFKADQLPETTDVSTYDQWFSAAKALSRKKVVGAQRYKEVKAIVGKSRDVEWVDFINEMGQLLPIEFLQNETAIERESRRQRIKREIAMRGRALRSVSRRGFELPRIRRNKGDR